MRGRPGEVKDPGCADCNAADGLTDRERIVISELRAVWPQPLTTNELAQVLYGHEGGRAINSVQVLTARMVKRGQLRKFYGESHPKEATGWRGVEVWNSRKIALYQVAR